METNDKERQQDTAERRRRMEARRVRQLREKRRRKKKIMLIVGAVIAAAALIAIIFFLTGKLGKGSKASSKDAIRPQGANYVIAIDPGHGGKDTGVAGTAALEKEITAAICSKMRIMLEKQGYTVVVLREEDNYLSREERVAKANESSADLLVSVHCGYSETDSSLNGAAIYYLADDRSSEFLGTRIQEELMQESVSYQASLKEGGYSILTDTTMPAALVEVGYQSNSREAEQLADDVYQNQTAKGIVRGILMSLEEYND